MKKVDEHRSKRRNKPMLQSTMIFGRVLLAVLIAGSATKLHPTQTKASAQAAHPNVVLITIDTLRADHVGCYGAESVKTPTLDGLARDGVVFERAISQVPLTWPSHAVILTGTYPFQNGVQDFTGQPLSPQFSSLAQAFKRAGYATGAVVSAFVLDRSWGLARGFDYYDDAFSADTFQKKDIGLVDRRAEESVAHAITWLKKTRGRPFFLWLHLYDPHSPYDPPEPYHSEYKSHPYDGEIAYADHELGKLFQWLKQNRLYDSALIVTLSDHGESLGEHGEGEHGFFVYHATTHVPLIVKPPTGSGIRAGRRPEAVETTAVASTILRLSGVKDPIQRQFQSGNLFGTKTDNDNGAYSETLYPFSSFGWSPLHSYESGRFHFVEAPKPELYDVEKDPGETHNVIAEQPAIASILKERMQKLMARHPFAQNRPANGNLTPEAEEKLRSLGYFGFRAAVSPEALKEGLADPKDKLWEFNFILKAADAFQAGDSGAGEGLLAKVQEQDPKIYVVPFMLGESAIRRKDWVLAAAQLQKCLDLNPNFDNAMTGLAYALAQLGQTEQAKTWLHKALQDNPNNYRAWHQMALLDAGTDAAEAKLEYEKAVTIQPNFSPGQRDLGMLLFQQKDYAAAAPHLEKAIALGLKDAHVHNYLGICYSRTDRLKAAVQSYHAALKLDAGLAEAHLNLAFVLQRMQEIAAAKVEYESACRLEANFCQFVPR